MEAHLHMFIWDSSNQFESYIKNKQTIIQTKCPLVLNL